ncbi:MAG TPA: hypothetical protein VNX87_16225 [Candidatus Sulfotelmatobacter sp.]|nr:hypothetical protein [Candidatus Sulfotelmatobacter sp.]
MSKQDSIPADRMEADALLRGVPKAEEEDEEEEGEGEEEGGENDGPLNGRRDHGLGART